MGKRFKGEQGAWEAAYLAVAAGAAGDEGILDAEEAADYCEAFADNTVAKLAQRAKARQKAAIAERDAAIAKVTKQGRYLATDDTDDYIPGTVLTVGDVMGYSVRLDAPEGHSPRTYCVGLRGLAADQCIGLIAAPEAVPVELLPELPRSIEVALNGFVSRCTFDSSINDPAEALILAIRQALAAK